MPDLEKLISGFITDVCELPDRTSPEDWPEAMLITGKELDSMLRDFATGVREITLRAASEGAGWTPIGSDSMPPAGRVVLVGWYSPHSKPAGKWFCFEAVYLDGTDEDIADEDGKTVTGWCTANECSCYDSYYLRLSTPVTHWAFKPITGPQGPQIDMPAAEPAQA